MLWHPPSVTTDGLKKRPLGGRLKRSGPILKWRPGNLLPHRQNACATGGGKEALEPPPLPAGILGESLLSGEVTGAERNTDVPYALDSLRDLWSYV